MLPQEIIDHICMFMPLEKAWYISTYAAMKLYDPEIHNATYWTKLTGTNILKYFLECKLIIDQDKDSICRASCQCGRNDILQLLLDYGMSISNQNFSMEIASLYQQVETVKFLISLGRSINGGDSKFDGFGFDGFGCMVYFIKYEVIKYLLENNHFSVKNDTTYIRKAFDIGNIAIAKLLLKHGSIFILEDNKAMLPSACNCGDIETVEFFLNHGIDPTAYDNLSIKYAKKQNHTEIVQLLLDHGCKY